MAENEEMWVPPTEAEIKILQAKRERSEKISKLMAEYLLKGYKMLSSCCSKCETVLLQDRRFKTFCVACFEIDNEHAKDDPALGGTAAQRQIEESQFSTSADDTVRPLVPQGPNHVPRPPTFPGDCASSATSEVSAGSSTRLFQTPVEINLNDEVVANCIRVVQDKMTTATKKLSKTNSPDGSLQWLSVLKACADTLISLKQNQTADNSRNAQ